MAPVESNYSFPAQLFYTIINSYPSRIVGCRDAILAPVLSHLGFWGCGMKIAMVAPYIPPRLGGREYWVHWMSRELVRSGVSVTLFTSNVADYHSSRMRSEKEVVEGVTIYKVPVLCDIDKYSTPVVIPPFRALRREAPDIVHLHEPNLCLTTPLALYAKFVLRKKVVTHCYGEPFDWYGRGLLFRLLVSVYAAIYALKLRISDQIIVLSKGYLEQSRYLPRHRDRIVILPMCLAPVFRPLPAEDVNAFKVRCGIGDKPVVLYVGRLDHRKGVDCLIRAMSCVDGRCLIVGKGDKATESYLRQLAVSLGLSDKVLFMGRQDQEELNRFYNACDVMVLPTSDETAETFGAVLLEAWAVRKPVISANNPAPADLINGSGGGLLVNREDPADLAKAINRVVGDKALAAQLGSNGYAYVQENFSYGEVSRGLIALYKRVLGQQI